MFSLRVGRPSKEHRYTVPETKKKSQVSRQGPGHLSYQFQIKDDLKAARIEVAMRTEEYVEHPKTSQRREDLDMGLELRQDRHLPGLRGSAIVMKTEICRPAYQPV